MSGKSEYDQLVNAFYNFDTDRDGMISCEDMKVVLMTKGAKMSREEVPSTGDQIYLTRQADEFVNECDFDQDGWINYEEVTQYLMQGDD